MLTLCSFFSFVSHASSLGGSSMFWDNANQIASDSVAPNYINQGNGHANLNAKIFNIS